MTDQKVPQITEQVKKFPDAPPSIFDGWRYISSSEYWRESFEKLVRTIQWITNKQVNLVMLAYFDEKTQFWYKDIITRTTWERYSEHPKWLALIGILECRETDPIVLTVCLLHDNLEDTYEPRGLIRKWFWDEIMNICILLTNPKEFEDNDLKKNNQELYRKIKEQHYKNIRRNIRAKKTKILDRSHNLRTYENIISLYPNIDQMTSKINSIESKLKDTRDYIVPMAEDLVDTNPEYLHTLSVSIMIAENNIKAWKILIAIKKQEENKVVN